MTESKWKDMAEAGTILRCRVGSQAYGLATTSSDLDEKGVCIEPFEAHTTLSGKFENYVFRTAVERTGKVDAPSEPGDLDLTIYSLEKFLRLATGGNPNIIEMFFVSGESVLECTQAGADLRDLTPSIVSRQLGGSYLGFMNAHAKRFLVDEWDVAANLIRAGLQGVELMETGKIVLPMEEPYRAQVMDIKLGKTPYKEIIELATDLEKKIDNLRQTSDLRATPNIPVVERWMREAYRATWERNRQAYIGIPSLTIH